MYKRGDEYWTTIESLEAAKAAPDGRDPEPYHVRMGMVTGSHHMQVLAARHDGQSANRLPSRGWWRISAGHHATACSFATHTR